MATKQPLTKKRIQAAKARDSEYFLWDGGDAAEKGLGVKVWPSGVKSFVFQFYLNGKSRRMAIGIFGKPWTVDGARKEVTRLRGEVAGGKDKAEERKEQKAALAEQATVEKCAELFIESHVKAKRKASTATEYQRLFDTIINPAFGDRKIATITGADIDKLHSRMRGTPYQANRVLAVLSKLFNMAELWKQRPMASNPCRHVEKYKEVARTRRLTTDELGRLGNALRAYSGSKGVVAAILLLCATGARLREILDLQWNWIDWENGYAELPDSKTGKKRLTLPPLALRLLDELLQTSKPEKNPHVIIGQRTGTALVNLEKPWRAIRHEAKLDDVRLHDLRHGFASMGINSGVSLPLIGNILHHTQIATTVRYAHVAADPAKAATAMIADKMGAALGLPAPPTD